MAKQQTSGPGWAGWILFAGVLMLAKGAFQIFLGMMSLINSATYLVQPSRLGILSYTAWGWVHIALGVLLIIGSGAVFSGKAWGRIVAIAMLLLSLLTNFAFLPAHPIWAVFVLTLDVVLLYALIVKGDAADMNQQA